MEAREQWLWRDSCGGDGGGHGDSARSARIDRQMGGQAGCVGGSDGRSKINMCLGF